MKNTQSSATAEGMALIRAIETAKPAAKRICYDPLARSLVNSVSYTLSKWFINAGLYDRISKGTLEFITARERYIDDFLAARLQEGLDQVVILGAGFDTRPYRVPGMDQVRVFEVDHPATQAVKRRRLLKVLHTLPASVTFVPVDFNTQTLEQQLLAAGYDEHGKTLFIWQGVTVYLTAAGVDSTLAFIAHHSAPESSVVFDYFYNETLRDTSRPEVKNMHRSARVTGEGYLFGIDQGRVAPFLSARGFHDVTDVSASDLKRLYFTGLNAGRAPSSGVGIASARVNLYP